MLTLAILIEAYHFSRKAYGSSIPIALLVAVVTAINEKREGDLA